MNFTCKPGRMVMGEAVPYGQRWTYYSTDPMKEMLNPEYFKNVAGQIRAGDDIRLLNIDGNGSVLELAEVLVTNVSGAELDFHVSRKPEKTQLKAGRAAPQPKLRTLTPVEDKGCVYLVDKSDGDKVYGEFANMAEARKAKPELERAA